MSLSMSLKILLSAPESSVRFPTVVSVLEDGAWSLSLMVSLLVLSAGSIVVAVSSSSIGVR